jgi:hypothetical protein
VIVNVASVAAMRGAAGAPPAALESAIVSLPGRRRSSGPRGKGECGGAWLRGD